MSLPEDIIGQAVRLAMASGLGLAGAVAVIIAAALVLVLLKRIGGINLPPYREPEPPPPAEWGDNVTPTDPDQPGGPGGGG